MPFPILAAAGIGGALGGLFGGGGSSRSTETIAPDANTQKWIDLWRTTLGGLGDKLGPNLGTPDYAAGRANIVSDFDRLRQSSGQQADDYATKSGAFGGDRSALFKAQGIADVNRQQGQTLNQYDIGTQQDQWTRALQLMGLYGNAAQVGGQTRTQTQQLPRNPFGDILGGATAAAGLYGSVFPGGKKGG